MQITSELSPYYKSVNNSYASDSLYYKKSLVIDLQLGRLTIDLQRLYVMMYTNKYSKVINMTSEQRQEYILNKVKEYGAVKIIDLSKQLSVSRETIRKDIYTLAEKNAVRAIRGGATTPKLHFETDYDKRMNQNVMNKQEIAKKAVSLLTDGDSLFLDYGTTTFELSTAIKNSNLSDLTIITNSIAIAHNLREDYKNHLIILGGNLRNSESSLSGPMTLSLLDDIYAAFGFFGCGGIQPGIGITNHYFDEVEVSKKAMQHCQKRVIIADHSKFKRTALYRTTDISNVDIILSDSDISTEERALFTSYDKKIE